jgi:ABC-type multidrug transport system ATPase subunit
MSEEILKALTQLFAVVSKQDGGVSEAERNFVIRFFEQELDRKRLSEYVALYDQYAEFGVGEEAKKGDEATAEEPEEIVIDTEGKTPEEIQKEKERAERKAARKAKKAADGDGGNSGNIQLKDSMRTLRVCKDINKTLAQKQKVIVTFKILEMLAVDRNFSSHRLEIIKTASQIFKIPKEEYEIMENFVTSTDSPQMFDSPDLLVFDEEAPPVESRKKFIDSGLLDGEIVFIRIKSVELYFTKYNGKDEIFLNGQVVKKGTIVLFSNGSVFKTPKGAPLYYSDLVTRYNDTAQQNPISFNAVNLDYRFPDGTIGLRNVNIAEGPGKLLSIMGASGAGKTTLLNVLAGLENPYKGDVRINGFNIHTEADKVEGVIGYVSQDDLLIEELSVYQNLYYNAKLCFKNLTEEQLNARVMDVLASLGLDRIKDITVGSVLNKMISGGQRKRLNIALELIREPAVMFVDEPTSGLSSRDSENVIDLLKELSLKGKLIFVVIHQPSSDIYKMFDKMILLDTGGYPIYYGNPVEAIAYFKRATNQVGSDNGQCQTCGTVTPELLFNIIEARVVNEYGEYTGVRKIAPAEWNDLYKQTHSITPVETVNEPPPNSLSIPSKIKQAAIFVTRDFLSKISNTQYMLINLLEAPLLALLLAVIVRFRNAKDAEEYVFRYNDNVPAYMLIAIIVALFMGLTVSAEEIIRDRKIQRRESFLNLSRMSYLTSKVGILFTLSAIQTLTFALIGNTILEIQGMYWQYWLVLFSISCFANALGLNISASFNSAVTVYILIPLLLIPQMILSGAIFRFDQLNNSIVEKGRIPLVADFMASRWAYEALAVEQFKDNPFERQIFDVEFEISQYQHKANFWIPKMQEILDRAANYAESAQNETADSVMVLLQNDIALLKHEWESEKVNEILNRLKVQAEDMELSSEEQKLLNIDLEKTLQIIEFDRAMADKLKAVLEMIRSKVLTPKFVQAGERKDSIINAMEQDPENKLSVVDLKNKYTNEYLEAQVKNDMIKDRFVEGNGFLVQQTDPIFAVRNPNNISSPIDYRTHFFAPEKHFFGNYFDTMWFNVFVMWFMTIFLLITLYFEWLKKLIDVLGSINFKKKKK